MTKIEPYYRTDDGAITVYCARWEDVHAARLLSVADVALVHADPPYGGGILAVHPNAERRGHRAHRKRSFTEIVVGDDRPFDPAPLLALDRPLVMWGANHYSDRVPGSPSWILWDKREGMGSDKQSDGELAWTNLGGPLRVVGHHWKGSCRASERGTPLHPTQKPIALSTYVFGRAKLKPGDLVFVPYLGSGPDLAAARAIGLRVIACDVESWCCKTAVSARLHAVPHPDPARSLGPLFAGAE